MGPASGCVGLTLLKGATVSVVKVGIGVAGIIRLSLSSWDLRVSEWQLLICGKYVMDPLYFQTHPKALYL